MKTVLLKQAYSLYKANAKISFFLSFYLFNNRFMLQFCKKSCSKNELTYYKSTTILANDGKKLH